MIKMLQRFAHEKGDSQELAFKKLLILVVASSCCICGIIWTSLYYFVFGWGTIAFLPLLFLVIVGSSIFIAHFSKNHLILVYAELICITWISAIIQWTIGGFDQSGFVTSWSFLGPIGALIFLSNKQAVIWMLMFLAIIVISAVFDPALLGQKMAVSPSMRAVFYIMNIGTAGSVVFAVAGWFNRSVQKEKQRSEQLLLNILPDTVAEELKVNGRVEPKLFNNATVLFTDFKEFTKISEFLSAEEMVTEINICFSAFDRISSKHHLEKIKTIGDSYMAVGGIAGREDCFAWDVVNAGLEMQQFIIDRDAELQKIGKSAFEMRVGIHSGHVVAGVVGTNKFQFDIWGDTVNTASRMETSGEASKVNISSSTYELVKDKFICEHRGKLPVKGKDLMDMYFVLGQIKPGQNINRIDQTGMEQETRGMLKAKLPATLSYHTIDHIEDVYKMATIIASHESVNEADLLLLQTAALYHDSGFIIQAEGHEAIGCELVKASLPKFGFSNSDINVICGMIMATKIPQSPKTKLEEILCDADLDYLGRDDYYPVSLKLFQELTTRSLLTHKQWLEIQIQFLEQHYYFTTYSVSTRADKKEEYLSMLRSELESLTNS